MNILASSVALALALAVVVGGCANHPRTTDFDLVTVPVDPLEYGRILCRGVSMEARHTCLTETLRHYERTSDEPIEPAWSTSGPFVLILDDGEAYRGTYVSNPFVASFQVRNAREGCRGRYDAVAGDERSVFRIRCEQGATGSANILLDHSGRNGFGEVRLDDGRRGHIVFGHAAVHPDW